MNQSNDAIEVRVIVPKDNKEIYIYMPWDANLDDWIITFKTILIHQTFSEDTVKEVFCDESETPTLPAGKVYLTADEN